MFAVPKAVGLTPADSGDGSGCATAAKVRQPQRTVAINHTGADLTLYSLVLVELLC